MSAETTPDLETLLEAAEKHDDGTVTLECPDCGHKITGAERGRGSASWKLGTHRYTKHGIRGSAKPKQPKGAPDSDALTERPVTATVTSIRSVMGAGTGTPTADQLANGLGEGLGLLTVGIASFAADTDPSIPEGPEGDPMRDELVQYLSLPRDAAQNMMRPVGRLLHGTSVNERYGRKIVDNIDVIGVAFDAGTFVMHWRRYFAARAAWAAGARPAAAPAMPGNVAPFPPAGATEQTSPAPQHGRVLTPDDIQRMRANG